MKSLICTVWFLLAPASSIAMDVSLPLSGDATPALNSAAAKICDSSSDRHLNIATVGTINFLTAPDAFGCALQLSGQGTATILTRRYSGGKFLQWVRGVDQSGGAISDINVSAGSNTHGGVAIYIRATPDTDGAVNSFNRHSFRIDAVLIGRRDGTSDWEQGIYLDGSQNPDGNPNSAPGIRGGWITRTSVSGTTGGSIYLHKARGWHINAECYIPLKGSFSGVVADGDSQGVQIISRSCGARFVDAASGDVMLNGLSVPR